MITALQRLVRRFVPERSTGPASLSAAEAREHQQLLKLQGLDSETYRHWTIQIVVMPGAHPFKAFVRSPDRLILLSGGPRSATYLGAVKQARARIDVLSARRPGVSGIIGPATDEPTPRGAVHPRSIPDEPVGDYNAFKHDVDFYG